MSKPIYWGIEILEETGTAKYRVQAPTGQPSQPSQLSQSNQPATTIHHLALCSVLVGLCSVNLCSVLVGSCSVLCEPVLCACAL